VFKKKVHAIILARGGSKGIKKKNLFIINKKPLIYWSIKDCLKSKIISQTWVSSDNDKILNVAKKLGARIIKRPKKLSTDKASSDSAWEHAIRYIREKNKIDFVVGVQPTSPIRSSNDFDNALKKFFSNKYDSLFSASDFETFFSWNIKNKKIKANYNFNKRPRRQQLKKSLLENGSFYIFDAKLFLKFKNRLFGKIGFYLMEKYKTFQIDTLEDAHLVNAIFNSYSNELR
jgi:N-acylneuraminate cytidylyltransferase